MSSIRWQEQHLNPANSSDSSTNPSELGAQLVASWQAQPTQLLPFSIYRLIGKYPSGNDLKTRINVCSPLSCQLKEVWSRCPTQVFRLRRSSMGSDVWARRWQHAQKNGLLRFKEWSARVTYGASTEQALKGDRAGWSPEDTWEPAVRETRESDEARTRTSE